MCFFFFLYGTRFFSLSLYLYKICRSARSTRVDRSRLVRKLLSPPLFYSFFFLVLFSQCTANYPPLISSRSRSPSSRITQDHPERDSDTLASLLSIVKASSLKCYLSLSSSYCVSFCFFFNFCDLFFFLSRRSESPRWPQKGHCDRDRSLPPYSECHSLHDRALAINKEESPTCMCARFLIVKKKGTISHK